VIGASILFVLLIIIAAVVGVCVRKCGDEKRRRHRSKTRRSMGADTFYNDASGTNKQVGPYEDIPDCSHPGTFNVYDQPEETYDELQESPIVLCAEATQVDTEGKLQPTPYQQLDVESRDPTLPSNPYKTLADTESTSETVTGGGEQVPAPYQSLEMPLRELPPLPDVYKQLNVMPSPTTVSDSGTKSYEMLEISSRELPKPSTEYNKLDCKLTQPTTTENEYHSSSSYDALQKKTRERSQPPGVYKKLQAKNDTKLKPSTRVTAPHSYIQVLTEHE
jgi:hypothetical protein